MRTQSLLSVFLVLAAGASVWSCSSSGDDSAGSPSGGASAGSAGKAGTAGHGGSSGGTAGHGGSTSTAGHGGSSAGTTAMGGQAGIESTGGAAGAGVEAGGAGGTSAGGMGGMGDAAGAGGAQNITDACSKICSDQAALACSFGVDCQSECTMPATDPDALPTQAEYISMIRCEAKNLSSASYTCGAQSNGANLPSALQNSRCKTEICAWECDPNPPFLLDEVVYTYCGCM